MGLGSRCQNPCPNVGSRLRPTSASPTHHAKPRTARRWHLLRISDTPTYELNAHTFAPNLRLATRAPTTPCLNGTSHVLSPAPRSVPTRRLQSGRYRGFRRMLRPRRRSLFAERRAPVPGCRNPAREVQALLPGEPEPSRRAAQPYGPGQLRHRPRARHRAHQRRRGLRDRDLRSRRRPDPEGLVHQVNRLKPDRVRADRETRIPLILCGNMHLPQCRAANEHRRSSTRCTFVATGTPPFRPHHLIASKREQAMKKHRIYTTSFASVYPHYVNKAERKGRTQSEVDEIICWLTGYSPEELAAHLEKKTDFETFFAQADHINPARTLIKGVVCGVRVEEVEETTMREIRYLDKLIDELAKGKAMEKILRK